MKFFLKIKTFIVITLFYLSYIACVQAKNTDQSFLKKDISNYFSGIISINNNNTSHAFEFLKKVKFLQNHHHNYNEKYLITLILLNKFDEVLNFIENLNVKNADFYEANILQGVMHFMNEDYLKAEIFFTKSAKNHSTNSNVENYLSKFFSATAKMAQNNQTESMKRIEIIPNHFQSLKNIQEVLAHCYFKSQITTTMMKKLANDDEQSLKRYKFFLINHLIHKEKFKEANEIISTSRKNFSQNILLKQTHEFIKKKDYKKIKLFFNCEDPKDVLAELFYIVANIYSNEKNYNLSNFYLNLSNYLNNNFNTNKTLLAENYFNQGKNQSAKKIYESLKKIGNIYSWHASVNLAILISDSESKKKATTYLEKEITKIPNTNASHYIDLANFLKRKKNYKKAIKYYSVALQKLDENDILVPEILYSRGTAYERINIWQKAEKDLETSLKISPDQPHVLNYLAYSWLEKGKNINKSMDMLKKAVSLKQSDAYIIDSLGWGFYLTKNYVEAEKLLREAIELMPIDPVIIDHYGDILWRLDKNIQAKYFWQQAQKLELEDKKFINKISHKLIFGLNDKS